MKSKYAWENDSTHSGYAYNDVRTWKGRQLKYLFNFIDIKFKFTGSSKCLDIGCNAALNLKRFKEEYNHPDNEYYGFDLNNTALIKAKQNLPEGKFKKCNFLLENPIKSFCDDFYDICFSTWVLAHLNVSSEREELIRDMIRVSKRGILFEPYMKESGPENPPVTRGNPDKFDVVVYDDYRKYSDLIVVSGGIHEKGSRTYYWDKTNET